MRSKGGDRLIDPEAVAALRETLLPLATLITPNVYEAAELLGEPVETPEAMEDAARRLAALGPQAVLVKGGARRSDPTARDVLCHGPNRDLHWLAQPRVNTANLHGTGCTLSSAIAASLAKGDTIPGAVGTAKDYLTRALQYGADYHLGHGQGPVHHFYQQWTTA